MVLPKKILLATDLSARCDRAFDRAVRLARQWNSHLTIATAIEGPTDDLDYTRIDLSIDEGIRAVVQEVLDEAARAQIVAEVIVRRGQAADVLTGILQERSFDLVVTGLARRTGFLRTVLGGTVERLLKKATAPVLMVKMRAWGDYHTALAGLDFSPGSRAALECAHHLFPELRPIVLHTFRAGYKGIASGPLEYRSMLRAAREDCEKFIAAVVPEWSELLCIPQVGDPVDELTHQAQRTKAELMVVGSNDRGTLAEFLLGSTGRDLISHAPCDLLMVPFDWQRLPTTPLA